MSKNTNFVKKLKPFFQQKYLENIPEVKIKISQWGLLDVTDWYYPAVCVQDWILYWNLVPGLWISLNGQMFCPDSRKVYLFPPYTKFGGRMEKEFCQFFIHFRANAPFDSVRNELITFSSELIKNNVQKAVCAGSDEMQSLYLTEIVLTALSQMPEKMFLPGKKNIFDNRVRKVIDVINKDPGKNHSIEKLCSMVNMSVNNFHRKFKNALSITPKQYILKKRMESAKELLLNGKLSIEEIAEQSGFNNRYHFSKAFKNYYNYPPIAYRKLINLRKKNTNRE